MYELLNMYHISTLLNINIYIKSDMEFCLQSCSLNPIRALSAFLLLAWISNYIHYKVCDEITYSFPNFNGVAVW